MSLIVTKTDSEEDSLMRKDLYEARVTEHRVFASNVQLQQKVSRALRESLELVVQDKDKEDCRDENTGFIVWNTRASSGCLSDEVFMACSASNMKRLVERAASGEDAKESASACPVENIDKGKNATHVVSVFPEMDHVHPLSSNHAVASALILHGDLGDQAFVKLVRDAVEGLSARPHAFKLVVRLLSAPSATSSNRTHLGGFGMALDVRDTEYKVSNTLEDAAGTVASDVVQGVDFTRLASRSDVRASHPNYQERLKNLRSNLFLNKLRPWDLESISVAAAHQALSAPDPLKEASELVHNFPSHVRNLAASNRPISPELTSFVQDKVSSQGLLELVSTNTPQHTAGTQSDVTGAGSVLVLGEYFRVLPSDTYANVLDLYAQVHSLQAAVANPEALSALVESRASTKIRVNIRKFAKGAIAFLNSPEKDFKRYNLPSGMKDLASHYSDLPSTRLVSMSKSLYTTILVLDLSQAAKSIQTISVVRHLLRSSGMPMKFGFVLTTGASSTSQEAEKRVCETETSVCDAACVARLFYGARAGYSAEASMHVLLSLLSSKATTCQAAKQTFSNALKDATRSWTTGEFDRLATQTLAAGDASEMYVLKGARFVKELRLPVPSTWVNGALVSSDEDAGDERLDQILARFVGVEQDELITLAHQGKLNDEEDLLTQLLTIHRALDSYSSFLSREQEEEVYLVLNEPLGEEFNYVSTTQSTPVVTVWVPISNSCEAASLVLNLVSSTSETMDSLRVSWFPAKKSYAASWWGKVKDATKASDFVGLAKLFETCEAATSTLASESLVEPPAAYVRAVSAQLPPTSLDALAMIVNGRVVPAARITSAADLRALISIHASGLSALPSLKTADEYLRLASTFDSHYSAALQKRAKVPKLMEEVKSVLGSHASLLCSVSTTPERKYAPSVLLLLDPSNPSFGSASDTSLSILFRDRYRSRVTLVVVPRPLVTQLPSPMSHYAFAYETHRARLRVQENVVLTCKISTPSAWIAYPFDFQTFDPDNFMINDKSKGARAFEYELAHVLLEGHAYVKSPLGSSPAARMQLELRPHSGMESMEKSTLEGNTIVMHNLGYWQIKASPGVYTLKSTPSSVYTLNEPTRIALGEYSGLSAPIEIKGTESVNKEEGSAVAAEVIENEGDDDVLHVFSLASGALYERLLRIMMLSVRKRTTGKLKFWLLENYMSTPMKAFLPAFAAMHDFSYELVTFKWPEWLRGQSERQRQIWGMKILFLDVIFPLNVKKVIYVDSDQVLRANLRELWTMDLKGHAVAMTPFCDSRKETLGFQFWRQGFWESHLMGKPYHISALFVVDLVVFRKNAVGDRLRAIYQQLTGDPNSLSNLDQDLPNYAQHDIPMFSLPQAWLWCESWCDDESKATAKTIDLCNNPLRKESKLSMARRIISGPLFPESWDELDAQIARDWDLAFSAR